MTRKEMVSSHTKVHGVAFSCQNVICSKERRHKVKNLIIELLKTPSFIIFAWKIDEDHIIYVIHHNRIYLDWGKFMLFLRWQTSPEEIKSLQVAMVCVGLHRNTSVTLLCLNTVAITILPFHKNFFQVGYSPFSHGYSTPGQAVTQLSVL